MSDAEDLPFYLLFSVIMAVLLAGLLAMHLRTQREVGVDQEAQDLADAISRTCFAALNRQQAAYIMPSKVGGSDYALEVDNNTIIVRVTKGTREGWRYYSGVNAPLEVLSLPAAGGRLYVQGWADKVIISAGPIAPPHLEIEPPKTFERPEFYDWAKGNQREAVAIAAAYFYALGIYPAKRENGVLDVLGYKPDGENVLVHLGYKGIENQPAGGSWTQTARQDFEAGTMENLDTASDPGDVKLRSELAGSSMNVRVYPAQDAYVFGREEWTNYNNKTLRIGAGGDAGFRAWLKFDLPPGEELTGAKLWLYFYGNDYGCGSPTGIAAHFSSTDTWKENGITWQNMPSINPTATFVVPEFADVGVWRSWDLTSDARREFGGDSKVTWCLKADVDDEYGLPDGSNFAYSRESTKNRPYLEVTLRPLVYASSGALTSSVFDAGAVIEWGAISWASSEPLGTSIELDARSSNDNLTWSNWRACTNGVKVALPPSRFIQYRATLRTSDPLQTPVLREVRVNYAAEGEMSLRVVGRWDGARVGSVENSWIVENIIALEENIPGASPAPSLENAAEGGWLYSPGEVLRHLRQRTWLLPDNEALVLPENLTGQAAAASVGGRIFCSYRFSFDYKGHAIKLFFRMLATDPNENLPGFTFTSEPRLEPMT